MRAQTAPLPADMPQTAVLSIWGRQGQWLLAQGRQLEHTVGMAAGCERCVCVPAGTTASSVQFTRASTGQPTSAILTGQGAQATFQNTAGQIVVVTSNTDGTTTIPIGSTGDPSVPAGAAVTVVSNNPSIPSTSSSPGRQHHLKRHSCRLV